jgi:hypothetical protein
VGMSQPQHCERLAIYVSHLYSLLRGNTLTPPGLRFWVIRWIGGEDVILSSALEPVLPVVPGRHLLRCGSGNIDVVPIVIVCVDHLLGALDARLALVCAVRGWLGSAQRTGSLGGPIRHSWDNPSVCVKGN